MKTKTFKVLKILIYLKNIYIHSKSIKRYGFQNIPHHPSDVKGLNVINKIFIKGSFSQSVTGLKINNQTVNIWVGFIHYNKLRRTYKMSGVNEKD